ncbi:ABC transporter ATP-binding protein [Beijerinckia indica]|uniref:ABC transporter related n=1 Tax=Beijerinckia indica subsp. indica (strain ATCC 9039 / DSM 1715 / NCIMB 8712) TaxID=395963 RepID=B2IF64_BEII9|nr:ABC transporter ATP-binding protein [Beijerinckia indica]ACB95629.1 ABC transporter related [Beijerinckia indica subsp. indica ATCC 9039]
MSTELIAQNLCYAVDGRTILNDLSFSVKGGDLIALLGTNGAGKTTLLRLLLRLLEPASGTIHIDGKPLRDYSRRDLARAIAYVPQGHVPAFPYTVLEIVMLGRLPVSPFGRIAPSSDSEVASAALRQLAIEHLAARPYTHLSGGERQAVLIARALAQGAGILVLDEPETGLDFGQQQRLFAVLRKLAQEGYAVLATTHDPLRARTIFNRAVLIQKGRIKADGPADSVLTAEAIEDLYGLDQIPAL